MKWKWGREITQWWRLEFKVRFRQQISSTFNFRRGSFFILIAKSISPKFLFIWTKQRIICTDKNIKLKRHATTTTTKKEKKKKKIKEWDRSDQRVFDTQNFLARESPAFRSVELEFYRVITAILFFITIIILTQTLNTSERENKKNRER